MFFLFMLGLLYCKKVKNDIGAGVGHPDELACSKEDGKVQHFFLQMIRNPYYQYIHENLRNTFNIQRDAYKNYLADIFR